MSTTARRPLPRDSARGALREAFRAECRRAFRPPYETPTTVVTNAVLMIAAWFLLPRSWLFRYTATPAFPLALASWMYCDVAITNVLGADAVRAVAALHLPGAEQKLENLLRAKSLLLWLLVAPVCIVLTLFLDFGEHRWIIAVATVVTVAVVPFGGLGIASWVGVRFPYHRQSLRWRWRNRRRYRVMVRWLALACAPYGVVPGVTLLILGPSLLLWTVTAPGHNPFDVTAGWFAIGVVLACVLAASGWRCGHRLSVMWAARRRLPLIRYLADPDNG